MGRRIRPEVFEACCDGEAPVDSRHFIAASDRRRGGAEDVTTAMFERTLRYRSGLDSLHDDPAARLMGIARPRIASPVEA